jgi:aminomethyltransferase
MKETAFAAIHEKLGAKMVNFAGWNMPVQYEGLKVEHQTVRNGVGVFDVSHMGEFIIRGEHAFDLVQKVTSNDVSKLTDGKVQYSCFPNGKGGIVDDLLVYRVDAKTYMLVVNASNIDKDWNWISENNDWSDIEMINISERTSLLAVQGPKAVDALKGLTTDMDLENMKYYTFAKGTFAGVENVLVSATGYTGAGGFEVYFDREHSEHIWNAIFEAGAEYDIAPIGLGARDTLRLEKGFCLYGNEITDETSPLEAGLGWITKLDVDFIGADLMRKEKEQGLKNRLVGFEMIDRGIPRHGYDITDADGNKIGHVTSGTMSPSTDKAIGMGYVPFEMRQPDTEIYIAVRKKLLKAKVVKIPFL